MTNIRQFIPKHTINAAENLAEFIRLCREELTVFGSALKWENNYWPTAQITFGKHLTDKDIEQIIGILDGWRDKLSWEALCDACLPVIGTKPARQTLIKFVRITNAFNACKKRLKEDKPEFRVPPSMKVAIERIARLERENERLKHENTELLQQYVVWQYNAYTHGISEHELNKALPSHRSWTNRLMGFLTGVANEKS